MRASGGGGAVGPLGGSTPAVARAPGWSLRGWGRPEPPGQQTLARVGSRPPGGGPGQGPCRAPPAKATRK
eukprot:175108-Chlamydomonas_euryale.AAC.1